MARKGLCDASVRLDVELEAGWGAALWVPCSCHPQAGFHLKVFPYWPDEGKGRTSAPLPVTAGGQDGPSLELCRMRLQDGGVWQLHLHRKPRIPGG